ncbi:glycosyltransferase [Lacihabitans sp. LS3-19]|uniref:glycosyltransferase n=1 Tax=Lacihabitans sp. LS3-19 TaxID=2487335 RepID=UPI0020CBEA14|nr:glycosyltransferase [Lacihabitans sp. LS3-19]MCP9771001.1 glycosyltransferase [Lacihabitans sp. LS3-19]
MNVKIVLPVYNDWEALKLLIVKTENIFKDKKVQLSYLAIDDCSSLPFEAKVFEGINIKVIHLISNQGHQRAIAIGLSHLADNNDADLIVVMDSDGEDQPEHIVDLIAKSQQFPDKIIFAKRKKRTESLLFRTFYLVYKFIFKFLTGHVITFGNFSLIPASKLKKIANVSDIWNNFPGGVIRSKLPFDSVPLDRGVRLAGNSKMNFSSLVLHGMSAISVFLDFTAVRILLFATAMVLFSVIGSGVALYMKFVLNQATPGWASNLVMAFFIVFLQGFFIALFILFMVLSSRRYTSFIPYFGYKKYIDFIE